MRRLAESYFDRLELRRLELASSGDLGPEYNNICMRQSEIAQALKELTVAQVSVSRVIYSEALLRKGES